MVSRYPPRDALLEVRTVLRRLAGLGDDRAELSSDEEARLVRNMVLLIRGLREVARRNEHVELWIGPETTLGAGRFDLYPTGDRRIRFATEEQYVQSDWTDPDRRAVAWRWRAERLMLRRDGSGRWEASSEGRVESDQVARLLLRADAWARRVNETVQWTKDLGRAPEMSRSRASGLSG